MHIGGSWADCLEMIKIRHPDVARRIVQGMATRSSQCFQAVEEAASRLCLTGVDTPNWEVLSVGLRQQKRARELNTGKETRHNPDVGGRKWRLRRSTSNTGGSGGGLFFVHLTEGISEITEWTIGFGAFHVIPQHVE